MDEPFKQTVRLNGFQPRSWGDIVAVATLLGMMMAVVAWGLKLEGELNAVRDRQLIIYQQIGQGVLPRADERIRHLERWVDHHESEHVQSGR